MSSEKYTYRIKNTNMEFYADGSKINIIALDYNLVDNNWAITDKGMEKGLAAFELWKADEIRKDKLAKRHVIIVLAILVFFVVGFIYSPAGLIVMLGTAVNSFLIYKGIGLLYCSIRKNIS